MYKRYEIHKLSKRYFQLDIETLSLGIKQVLSNLASETYLFFLYYIIVNILEINNFNKKLIFNMSTKFYILF